MPNDTGSGAVREAVGTFFDTASLREAIGDLRSAGFDRAQIGLLAGELTVSQRLGEFYTQTNALSDDPDAPRTAFVEKESAGDPMHGMLGVLSFVGSAAAGGAIVATAGILGGAIAAATAGVAALGGVGLVFRELIDENDAEHLEEQINEGHMLLFVRTRDAKEEERAADILSKHAAYDVRILNVPEQERD